MQHDQEDKFGISNVMDPFLNDLHADFNKIEWAFRPTASN